MRRFLLVTISRVRMSALITFVGLAFASHAQTITTFDPPDSTSTVPTAINLAGQITGYYSPGADTWTQSFLRQPDGTIITFAVDQTPPGGFPGDNAYAMDINAFGQITGWYVLGGPFVTGSFLRRADGTIITFTGHAQDATASAALEPAPRMDCSGDGSVALAINAAGQITGTQWGMGCLGFLRQRDGDTINFSLSTPGFISDTLPQAINLLGQITGYYDDEFGWHGFLRQPNGTIVHIDVPNSISTFPRAINLLGQITGYYSDTNSVVHGFLRQRDGTIVTFDPVGSTVTDPTAINDLGRITGYFLGADNTYHGFVRERNGVITTFDVQGAGGTFPQDINLGGQITGYYQDANLVLHGFDRSAR